MERSTGNKKVEEWNFLPKDWKYPLNFWGKPPIFKENFVILKFHTWLSPDHGDTLILNLITRRPFWMWSRTLVTQMKEKAAGQVDFGGLGVTRSEPCWMEVESDRLVVRYIIRMEGEFTAAELG